MSCRLGFEGVPLITMNGLSKNWLLPGSRVESGWSFITHLQKGCDAIIRLANARLSGPTPHQYAVKTALEGHRPPDSTERTWSCGPKRLLTA